MTNLDHGSRQEPDAQAKTFSGEDDGGLPEAIYPLHDGSYADRQTLEIEQADLSAAGIATLPWGQGALLLNSATKSYLTPFGFKALFKQRPKMILDRFARAGLDPDRNYYLQRSPDILIHQADGRFVPVSRLPKEENLRPLLARFREEDIYLQNFNREGSKRTGSYISYAHAGQLLKARHTDTLEGVVPEEIERAAPVSTAQDVKPDKRVFKYRPRTRGLTRRRSEAGASKVSS